MAFAVRVDAPNQLVDVESLLDGLLNVARAEIRHCARLVKHYTGVPPVRGDDAGLRQLFFNLIVNAARSATLGSAERSALTLSTWLGQGRVVVEVANARGSAATSPERAPFQPLVADSVTKPADYGLALCHSIATAHGGEIEVSATRGDGDSYRVFLPLGAPISLESNDLNEPPKSGHVARARILVVDDEPLLGQTLSFAFSGKHDMVLASSGREALLRLEENPAFDLVLCDLMMPDVSGSKVFETVERTHPELVPRFAFMTGGAFTDKAQEFLERYHGHCIDKPFTISDVERLLDSVLRAEPRA